VAERIRHGSHFAQPTPDAVVVAEELARRFRLPLWRFCNSGTEATMDAVHLMRAATGRDRLVKFEGAYHGHHDSVMVSVTNSADEIGDAAHPVGAPSGSGLPRAIVELTVTAHFNDAGSVARAFDEHPGEIAGVLMEPILMNAGIIPPEPGFVEAVRDIAHDHGALLAFDEVKTGLTVAPGGAVEHLGVTPDLVCLAKAMGGGLPCGALGGSKEVMGLIADGTYDQVGTFNGNPLTMAAARATLTEALDASAYENFDALRAVLVEGCEAVIAEHGLAAHVVAVGAKGCITFSPERVRNYREFLEIDDRFSHCHWLYQHNGGVFLPPWGKAEQWLVSAQHTRADADRFVANFARMAEALRG
jgi:glutamate-1-semialdehyde 2,1-aminomutase